MTVKVGQKPQIYATRPLGGTYTGNYGVHTGSYVKNRGLVDKLNAYDTYQAPVYRNTCSAGDSPLANKFDIYV